MHISRFVILALINLPIVIIGITGAIVNFKTRRTSKRRYRVEVFAWVVVGACLVMVEPIYSLLLANNLTASDSMSIFDIVLLTLVLLCGLFIIKANEKISLLNSKLSRIHEHIAIKEAKHNK